MQLTTKPYKGTKDLLPKDFSAQQYIFNTWTKVCERFGYKQYLTPTMELADIYRAKSGEVKEELFTLRDRADRDLALRPEMTPSVTRLVSSIYKESPKPIRLFSIANFFRNEAPQKGRYREFWQLNFDIFGESSVDADIEIMSILIEIMLEFGAPANSFMLYFNNRILIDSFFKDILKIENTTEVARIMDKAAKLSGQALEAELKKLALDESQITQVKKFLNTTQETFEDDFPTLVTTEGYKQIKYAVKILTELSYNNLFEFRPNIIRGFEYYDGMVYEVFDLSPDNNRSLCGGGRYNGLSEIFGVDSFSATGSAPGNVTTQLFLENWDLLPEYKNEAMYCPLLDSNKKVETLKICNNLRKKGYKIENDFDPKTVSEAIRYAVKRGFSKIILLGENEFRDNTITIKNLEDRTQETKPIDTV